MTYVIALPCVDLKDKSCIDECPVDCIYEGERMLYIHPDECVDCGACEPSARWKPSTTRMTPRKSGLTTTMRMSNSLMTSAPREEPPNSG